jgi:succinylglutamic semialdehyde dehydrogenase
MSFASYNPATGEKIWEGKAFDKTDIDKAVIISREVFLKWSNLGIEKRIQHLKNFQAALKEDLDLLSHAISEETGKPLWDSKSEVNAMINKIDISISAYQDRCPEISREMPNGFSHTSHKPHGVIAVFGPYNFPCHLPNGHLVPALLAGNTCLFKPSELTPHTAEVTMKIWGKSGLPQGVIQLVLGGKETGQTLAAHVGINGLFFTGSFPTGQALNLQFANHPEKILALEMGGNNPLIVHEVSDVRAASYLTIQSAFLSSGQRCTCARRLIIVDGKNSDSFLDELIRAIQTIKVGAFTELPEPFMGPVVSASVAKKLLQAQKDLITRGGIPLVEMKKLIQGDAFLFPGLIDVTHVKNREDQEFFGPFLQVIRVKDFESAINEANQTAYGLSSGLLSDNKSHYEQFYKQIKAGIVNWNTPLTGASSNAPFGGIGHSGNYRPSAYYAADYCAYPVASIESPILKLPTTPLPGLNI